MFEWNMEEYSSFNPLEGLQHTNFDEYFPKESKDLFSFLRTYIKDNESESSDHNDQESTNFIEMEMVDIDTKENNSELFSKIIYSLM